MRKRLVPICLAVPAVAVPLAFAGASDDNLRVRGAADARAQSVSDSPDLWATINVCDTPNRPDTIGIRGSMPPLRRLSRLMMRFQVQYLARADGKWHNIAEDADSGWIDLGRRRNRVVESGRDFRFLPPEGGGAHRLRGSVRFKWVARGGRVLERERRFTESGHRSTAGADPPGYSATICDIT